MPTYERDYRSVALALQGVSGNRHRRMNEFCDVIWRFFKDHGVSWVGFYEKDPNEEQMILGPSRDKPACSPIELRGACGMSWERKRPLIVNDVHNLGEHYIACDPKDRSEIVIPLFNDDGSTYGVLDIDSFDRNAFNDHDLLELRRLLESTAISWPAPHLPALVY
ncbi:MAG: GAF domain-containing protein [Phycisphaerales bacterium]|nr:GAF domain-containing protein [Phycisphaerales bacterium]